MSAVFRKPETYILRREENRRVHVNLWPQQMEMATPQLPLLCVHGLTRNSRDFDYFAQFVSLHRTIICPDIAGRGKSDWLPSGQIYGYDVYFADVIALLDALGIPQVDWLGTSMGGILGMQMAAAQPHRIRRLILNDIGAVVPLVAMQRIDDYVGRRMQFASRAEAENTLRETLAGFGLTQDWQWQHFFATSMEAIPEGTAFRLRYDPAILNAVRDEAGALSLTEDISLWPLWEAIPHPTLLLRGEDSDFLSAAVAQEMLARRPKNAASAQLVTFPHCGHAPALMDESQLDAIANWLL